MACDMVVALAQATVQRNTLVGLNLHGHPRHGQRVRRWNAHEHAIGEMLCLGALPLPQARQTCAVLGSQPQGCWGLTHGINEHGVAAGSCRWQSKLPPCADGLAGTDLVRLTLERSQSARQAMDVLTDLVARHGQRADAAEESADHAFLLADGKEAFVVETAGKFWASLECQQVRAISDVGLIRQDWRRLALGLGEFILSQGWWPDDGSKVDVAGCLGTQPARHAWALKRFGKATLLLEQQNGHIDHQCLRRLLSEHFELAGCARPRAAQAPARLLASFIGVLPAARDQLPLAWCTFGPATALVYMPIFLVGDLPPELDDGGSSFVGRQDWMAASLEDEVRPSVKDALEKLQYCFDRETEEFLNQVSGLWQTGDRACVARLAGALMRKQWELLHAECRRLRSPCPQLV